MKKRNRRDFLKASALGVSMLLAPGCLQSAQRDSGKKPNIIFLMDDQHRWDTLGIVDPAVQTPNLDALAKSGIFFDQAVCQAPMCIPSRNSMMLGLYPNQLGCLKNGRSGIKDGDLPAKPLAVVLKNAGYQTAGFGKTHWGGVFSTRGFETRYIGQCPENGAVMMRDDVPEAKKRYDAEGRTMGPGEENNFGYLGFTSSLPEEEHRDGWVTKQCLNFIENGIDSSRPLFLYLSFLKPHAGHNVPAGYEDLYDVDKVKYAKQPPWEKDVSPHALGINDRGYIDYWSKASDKQWRQMTMRYRANCTWIDDMFGRTIAALKRKGMLDNALVVYCSDHGEMLGERFYRFNKYCLYESSVRVPMIVSGSALPKGLRGKIDHRPAELVDFYPTILKTANVNIPGNPAGLNLLGSEKRQASFCALHERKKEAAFMWRTESHKLILRMKRNVDDNASKYTTDDIIGGEFYDLVKDDQEWNNLYSSGNPMVKKMTTELLVHLKKLNKLSRQ